ncbi:MAG TPA: hypothetical protein VK169_15235 [Saprospiraceae bacterium]|nr:hypothetical protein [Saprospiraceae bacterium]
MDKCFVIQPFDEGKFDDRYIDIFEPAIKKAELEPYRIDQDLSVRIPIEDIEKGIYESVICFADITMDNPNVWYELGFAFACGKDVVMVCSDERTGKFPFDIQHRQIIKYKTGSTSYFNNLEELITKKIVAYRHKTKTITQLNSTPVVETEGLASHEIAILILIMENQFSSEDFNSAHFIGSLMGKSGYTDIATSVGMRSLVKKGMIEIFKTFEDYNNSQEYTACRLTDKGENWILSNQDQLVFRKNNITTEADEDLPF